jgi:hypothetical protein
VRVEKDEPQRIIESAEAEERQRQQNEAQEQGEVGQILLRQIHLEQEQLHLIQQHCSNSCKIYAY